MLIQLSGKGRQREADLHNHMTDIKKDVKGETRQFYLCQVCVEIFLMIFNTWCGSTHVAMGLIVNRTQDILTYGFEMV